MIHPNPCSLAWIYFSNPNPPHLHKWNITYPLIWGKYCRIILNSYLSLPGVHPLLNSSNSNFTIIPLWLFITASLCPGLEIECRAFALNYIFSLIIFFWDKVLLVAKLHRLDLSSWSSCLSHQECWDYRSVLPHLVYNGFLNLLPAFTHNLLFHFSQK